MKKRKIKKNKRDAGVNACVDCSEETDVEK